jgi:hypothetical protein
MLEDFVNQAQNFSNSKILRLRPLVKVLLGESLKKEDATQFYCIGSTEFWPCMLSREFSYLVAETILEVAASGREHFDVTPHEIRESIGYFATLHFGSNHPNRFSWEYRRAVDRLVYNVTALVVQRVDNAATMRRCVCLLVEFVDAFSVYLLEINNLCNPTSPLHALIATLDLLESSVFNTLNLTLASTVSFLLFNDEIFRLAIDQRDVKIESKDQWTAYLWLVCSRGFVAVNAWCRRFCNDVNNFPNAVEFYSIYKRETSQRKQAAQMTPDRSESSSASSSLKRVNSSSSCSSPVAKRLCMV